MIENFVTIKIFYYKDQKNSIFYYENQKKSKNTKNFRKIKKFETDEENFLNKTEKKSNFYIKIFTTKLQICVTIKLCVKNESKIKQ